MEAWPRSWWQKVKQHRVTILVGAIALVVAITLIIVGYWFDWAGFNGYNKITVAHTISGTNAGTVIRTEEYQPGRTLWDWMQLLIIPVVLALGGYLFTFTISRNERKAADRHNQTEREIAQDNQREAALQEYIDKMSELLMHEKLRESQPKDEVRIIAYVRTLTVLPRLDGKRKGSVLQFLHKSGLIEKVNSIVDLEGTDLTKANLMNANLTRADLSKANLYGAFMNRANMYSTNLTSANLRGARLSGANLTEANLELANLVGASLIRADLTRANLTKADLTEANLLGANLSSANLFATTLIGADLTSAELTGAELRMTNLTKAKLVKADLSDAKLFPLLVTDEQLEQTKSLKGVAMPDGSIHP